MIDKFLMRSGGNSSMSTVRVRFLAGSAALEREDDAKPRTGKEAMEEEAIGRVERAGDE